MKTKYTVNRKQDIFRFFDLLYLEMVGGSLYVYTISCMVAGKGTPGSCNHISTSFDRAQTSTPMFIES